MILKEKVRSDPSIFWAMLVTFLLHVAIIFIFIWFGSTSLNGATSDKFSVVLPIYLTPSKIPQTHKIDTHFNQIQSQTVEKIATKNTVNNQQNSNYSASNSNALSLPESKSVEGEKQFDKTQIASQIKNIYLEDSQTAESSINFSGDYYGTYSGDDMGTFFVHVDNAGIALGSGQSTKFGVNFSIKGAATSDGFIKMSGSGLAGKARFEGKLNKNNGTVVGTWSAGVVGRGTFSGKHE